MADAPDQLQNNAGPQAPPSADIDIVVYPYCTIQRIIGPRDTRDFIYRITGYTLDGQSFSGLCTEPTLDEGRCAAEYGKFCVALVELPAGPDPLAPAAPAGGASRPTAHQQLFDELFNEIMGLPAAPAPADTADALSAYLLYLQGVEALAQNILGGSAPPPPAPLVDPLPQNGAQGAPQPNQVPPTRNTLNR